MCVDRIREHVAGGAWCPAEPISKDSGEFLEVDLGRLMVITLVETQGRFDNGQVGRSNVLIIVWGHPSPLADCISVPVAQTLLCTVRYINLRFTYLLTCLHLSSDIPCPTHSRNWRRQKQDVQIYISPNVD